MGARRERVCGLVIGGWGVWCDSERQEFVKGLYFEGRRIGAEGTAHQLVIDLGRRRMVAN